MLQTVDLDFKQAEIFLNHNNITNYRIVKIAGDASFRSYYRITTNSNSYVLMYAPPQHEEIMPFIKIARFLIENKFLAPEIFAHDQNHGFILLKDFGDLTYNRFLSNFTHDREKLVEFEIYQKACDVLVALYFTKVPDNFLPKYDEVVLLREVMIFVDYYLKLVKKEITAEEKLNFQELFLKLFGFLSKESQILVLRDYHVDNLMILSDDPVQIGRDSSDISKTKVGILDFQDALIGSPAYDLVSLLEDSRYDISDAQRKKLFDYYLNQLAMGFSNNLSQNGTNQQNFINYSNSINKERLQFNKEQFILDYNILSIQRNIKIIGVFSRLFIRDGKKHYLSLVPTVISYVKARFEEQNLERIDNQNFVKVFLELKQLILKLI